MWRRHGKDSCDKGLQIIRLQVCHARTQGICFGMQRGAWRTDTKSIRAAEVFRITAKGVEDETQIHAHMCYSEFIDIMAAVTPMDADVITIETAPSDMERLAAFEYFDCPNRIESDIYNIHPSSILAPLRMIALIKQAAERLPAKRLWVHPDCGLKTRQWGEVIPALTHGVAAAGALRACSD